MAQRTGLVQIEKLGQTQTLTPQQMLLVRLTEMPIIDLEQCVKDELADNPGLEEGLGQGEEKDLADDIYGGDNDEGGKESETELLLGNYSSDDDIPDYLKKMIESAHREEMPIGDTVTFLNILEEQIIDYNLTEKQQDLIYYLIGSLNDDGFLDQSTDRMVDELLFNHDIDTSEEEIEETLHILQQFDPAGIGARDLQECLLIQIERKMKDENLSEEEVEVLKLEHRIISDEFENFKNRNYDKIANELSIEKSFINYVIQDLKSHYNPRPGRALCESASDRVQTAIPDFIIETDGEGNIDFALNSGFVPRLHVSEQYKNLVRMYQIKGDKMSKHDKDNMSSMKQKIEAAQGFIEAIMQRQQTLTLTMKAIIKKQRKFFITKDDEDLQSLILKDVADITKLDTSTISRVCKSKYALVDGKMYPLSYFFKHNRKNSEGVEIDANVVSQAITQIIDAEDKRHPFTDEQLVEKLKEQGINIKRRTASKYRISLAIPTAQKRKV